MIFDIRDRREPPGIPFSLFRFIGERFSGNGYYGLKRLIEQSRIYRSTMNDYLIKKDQQDPDSYHLMWPETWSARTFSSQKPVIFEEHITIKQGAELFKKLEKSYQNKDSIGFCLDL